MATVRELRGKRVVVLGLGKSGLAATRLLLREGARVIATDSRSLGELDNAVMEVGAQGAVLELGGHRLESFLNADLIVKSPGIGPRHVELSAARAKGVPVIGEVELCVPWIQGPVVAITGTNGKSTTTALTGHLLETAGLNAFVGGNLGTPISEQVLAGGKLDATVLELSSYQIDDLETFRCDVAAVLNITPDHLERYGTIEKYAASKERLLSCLSAEGIAILNQDDGWTRVMGDRTTHRVVTFGHGSPVEKHLREKDGVVHRTSARSDERYTVTARTLRGSHNLENAMAAIEVARAVGATAEAVQRGLDTYPGLPHRLEVVLQLDGVEWVNDSKATNVDSVEKSLAAFPGPLHLIMGGKGKGAPYEPLRRLFPGRVLRLYVIGQDAERIAEELGDLAPVERTGDLTSAIQLARRNARPGETVLLAPACASFDQFKSFEQRGQLFREVVEKLPKGTA